VWYGFAIRGLHRLQVDTLAGNTAMIRAAERAGFVPEGRLRQAAWAGGDFADVVILGLLAAGWDGGRRHRARARSAGKAFRAAGATPVVSVPGNACQRHLAGGRVTGSR
jgi:hypothetical protein